MRQHFGGTARPLRRRGECDTEEIRERDEPAAPIRGRDCSGRGGLEGVVHPLHGWGFEGGGALPCPLMGERLRGAGQPPSQRSSGRSIRSELLAYPLRSRTGAIAPSPQRPARRFLAAVRSSQRRPPQPVAVPQQEEPFPLPLPLPRRFPLRAATWSTNHP